MKFLINNLDRKFFARENELKKIAELLKSTDSKILCVYGRRRVGKTELIEQALKKQRLIKIEGIQNLSFEDQIFRAQLQLAHILENSKVSEIKLNTWYEFFELLYKHVYQNQSQNSSVVLYLEELQWLANYSTELISDLKYFWDNYFRKIPGFLLVLCGSSPSFMINSVINSSALYNRSQHTINLKQFSLSETIKYLGSSYTPSQVLEAYLTVGGIPEYLNYLKQDKSIFLALCKNSFLPNSFFNEEKSRVFISSLRKNKYYEKIVDLLAQNKYLERNDIVRKLERQSGGDLSMLFEDLEKCELISSYSPFYLNNSKKLVRYQIADQYLQFYYKFILPLSNQIENSRFIKDPTKAIAVNSYNIWLGFAFERWIRSIQHKVAAHLGFGGVEYKSGTFFSRKTTDVDKGFQWDLVFDRKDKVLTLCEIKYYSQQVDSNVIEEFEKKVALLPDKYTKNRTIQRVLIAPNGISQELENRHYFDFVLDLDSLCTF